MSSRRDFLRQVGIGAAAGALLPLRSAHSGIRMNAPSDIQLGYAAITWGGNDEQAIDDISALGFPGHSAPGQRARESTRNSRRRCAICWRSTISPSSHSPAVMSRSILPSKRERSTSKSRTRSS